MGPPELAPPRRVVQIVSILVSIRARSGAFAAKAPLLARTLTRLGTICIARRGGVGSEGTNRPAVSGIRPSDRPQSSMEGVVKSGVK